VEGSPVIAGVDILCGVIQEIKRRIPRGCPHPFLLVKIRFIRHEKQHADPTGSDRHYWPIEV